MGGQSFSVFLFLSVRLSFGSGPYARAVACAQQAIVVLVAGVIVACVYALRGGEF